ncbi:potassium channel family protein [Rheinheimera sp. WS51]|uniref:potassium channel family protein n=1 Tax=Rheinheimera sp. WS51 TaxID=3425886 RepID=UPI003D92F1FC
MLKVFVINSLVVAICVMLHYEFLHRVTVHIPKMTINHRTRIVLAVFSSLVAHAVEVWVFAIAYYFMHQAEGWGQLSGNFSGSLMDCAYFSFTVFSTLGFGDIVPSGDLRYLTGIESLTGLVLVTWTASFLFLEMQRFWGFSHENKPSN